MGVAARLLVWALGGASARLLCRRVADARPFYVAPAGCGFRVSVGSLISLWFILSQAPSARAPRHLPARALPRAPARGCRTGQSGWARPRAVSRRGRRGTGTGRAPGPGTATSARRNPGRQRPRPLRIASAIAAIDPNPRFSWAIPISPAYPRKSQP